MDKLYENYIADFKKNISLDKDKQEKVEKLRKKFVEDYSKENILKMKIDDYITGKGNKNTFCNRIETELKEWGNMKGAYASKFGVYYGTDGPGTDRMYRYINKFGDTLDEAFEKIKREIINLIEAGGNNNFNIIKDNLISPMLKGKILSIYYPNEYLNIFSSSHLDYFINQLNLKLIKGIKEIEKQKILLEYKNNDPIMKSWSVYEFGRFLYYLFGSPTNNKVKGVMDNDNNSPKIEIFPNMENVNDHCIELNIKQNSTTKGISSENKKVTKIDFEKKNRDAKRIGDRGELIVLQSEMIKLKNKKELLESIKHISKEDDSAGYDILSFDENGNEIYIEVKSTKGKPGDINFYLTANELDKANRHKNYWIYIVFEANTDNPKIWKINNPFINNKDNIRLEPVSFRVGISVE